MKLAKVFEHAFPFCDNRGCNGIADNIGRGAAHV